MMFLCPLCRRCKKVTQHLHMRQYVARPEQDFKSELIVGAGLERDKWTAHDTFNFYGWCSETRT